MHRIIKCMHVFSTLFVRHSFIRPGDTIAVNHQDYQALDWLKSDEIRSTDDKTTARAANERVVARRDWI